MSVWDFGEEYFVPYTQNAIREARYVNEIKWISKYLSGQRKVLDFGCGVGAMLEKLRNLNFDAKGCDVSEYAIKECEKKNLNVFLIDRKKGIKELAYEKFDLIIFRGVFQHLSAPNLLFKEIVNNHLNENGLIAVLATPNIDSLLYKVSSKLPALSKDIVSNFPSKKIIIETLEANKLKIVDFRYPYFRTGYDKLIPDFVNFMKIAIKIDSKLPNFPGNMVDVLAKKS